MFADALLDSHHQSRRGWATVTSFTVQAVAIACLLVIPLFYTQVLPRAQSIPQLVLTPLGDTQVAPPEHTGAAHPGSSIFTAMQPSTAIIAPGRMPHGISSDADTEAPNVFVGTGTRVGTLDGILGIAQVFPPDPIPRQVTPSSQRLIISRMMEGSLIHRVEPIYPALAITARIQGTVVLEAIIGRDGTVKNLQALNGHPLLIPAAINAVSQWRYRPYLLNDVPVEVDTHVTVNFILSR